MRRPVRFARWCGLLAVLACIACGEGHRDILGTEKKLYSQFDEELIIRDFFQDRRGGVFPDQHRSKAGGAAGRHAEASDLLRHLLPKRRRGCGTTRRPR